MSRTLAEINLRPMSKLLFERDAVAGYLGDVFGDSLHAKRVASLAGAITGLIEAAVGSIHAIGLGLATAAGLDPKHATKQVDRLLSNEAIHVWGFFARWVPYIVGPRDEIVVALDWTDFDRDSQTTIALHLINSHGRSTPLVWKTVAKDELKDRRNEYEDEVLLRLRELVGREVRVTVLADRGFGDQKLFQLLRDIGFAYVIRIRGVVKVQGPDGVVRAAKEWVAPNGRVTTLRRARVTREGFELGAFVCVKAKAMKDAWLLATSYSEKAGSEIVSLYGRRFTIEETFRDLKSARFGFGIEETRIAEPARRDRLLLIAAMAIRLLTMLGEAGERAGLDRMLKTNTSKKRTLSLLRQGRMLYDLLPKMKEERVHALIGEYAKLLAIGDVWAHAFRAFK